MDKDRFVLGLKKTEILGHVISGERIKPDPRKEEPISKAPKPENIAVISRYIWTFNEVHIKLCKLIRAMAMDK